MKLNALPYFLMESGRKTIELRLNDEKRSRIVLGDSIVFTHRDDDSRRLTARVAALHHFESFEKLYASLPLEKCGYLPDEICSASYRDMEEYYSPDEQRKYGVVGIEIVLE